MKKNSALNPTVVRLGLVSLFADISSEMLYPITPLFLTTVLGASMASVGLIEGVAEALASLLKTYAGAWSDRIGKRKPFIWSGYLLAAVAKPVIALASSWGLVLFARALDRTGKGLRTAPRDALLADSVEANQRGAAFGWHRAMDTTGAIVGPLLALLFLNLQPTNLRPIFFWAFLPGLFAVFLALTLKDKPREPRPAALSAKATWRSLSPQFKVYLGGWTAFSVANSSDVFLLLRAKECGASNTSVILLYTLYNFTYAGLSPYLGKLSDTLGRKRCLLFGLVLFALVYAGFSLAIQTWHFVTLFGLYGIYMAATDGVGKALAVDLVAKERKATALGVLGTFTGVSTLIASVIAGLLWEKVAPSATFLYGAAGSLTAVVLIGVFLKEKAEPATLAPPL